MRTVSDETLNQTIAALEAAGGNQTKAASILGIARSTLQERLERASARGITGGSLSGTLPPGQVITGVSTLYNKDGDLTAQWVKTKQEQNTQDLVDAITAEFDKYHGLSELYGALPIGVDADLATFYIVSDHHLGLYAWEPEAGEDYDVAIGEKLLLDSMGQLVSQAPASKYAVVLNLGDFFHSDSDENRTRRSGNKLDVDTRYARVLQAGVALMIQTIDLAKQKHQQVLVRCLPGNHDPYAALALSVALAQFYANDERVTVDTDPSPFFWWTFGKVMVGSTHGDMIKHTDMPGVMAAYKAKEWGNAEYRYIYLGHVHHKSIGGGEKAGVVWETFQTLAAKDAWHRQSGYSSGRSMVAITHHKDKGEVYRHTVSIKGAS